MTLAMEPNCQACQQSMMGNDLLLRCRVNGLPCSAANADGCTKFIYEPGTDAEEITVNLCDCQGRGD